MSMNDKPIDGFFEQPEGSMPKIEKIWAFVALDSRDGNEGIVAMQRRDGITFPLIASDRVRLDEYRPLAQQFANELKVAVRLVEFQTRYEVELLEPK